MTTKIAKNDKAAALIARVLEQLPKAQKNGVTHYLLVAQQWWEYERGWGSRPDGYTLHLSNENLQQYVKGYNAAYNNKTSVPDEYTVAQGDPRIVAVTLDVATQVVKTAAAPPAGVTEGLWLRFGIWGDGNVIPEAWKG